MKKEPSVSNFNQREFWLKNYMDSFLESLMSSERYLRSEIKKNQERLSALEKKMDSLDSLEEKPEADELSEEERACLERLARKGGWRPRKIEDKVVKGMTAFSHSMYLGKAVTIHGPEGKYPREFIWRYNTEKGNPLYWRGFQQEPDISIQSGQHYHSSFSFRVYKEPMDQKYYYLDTDTDRVYLLE